MIIKEETESNIKQEITQLFVVVIFLNQIHYTIEIVVLVILEIKN